MADESQTPDEELLSILRLDVRSGGEQKRERAAFVDCPVRDKEMELDECLQCPRFRRMVLPEGEGWIGICCRTEDAAEDA